MIFPLWTIYVVLPYDKELMFLIFSHGVTDQRRVIVKPI